MAISPSDLSHIERGADEFQQRVVDAPERSIRVLAPAGSGKTETLVRRVQKRVGDGVDSRRILVLTFDTNANGAFIAKMGALGLRQRPDTRTLNAFGLWVLRQFFPQERHNVGQPSFLPVDPTLGRLVEMTERRALTEIFGILKSHVFDPRDTDRASKAALQKFVRTNYQRLVPEAYFARFGFDNAAPFARAVGGEFRRYESFLADRGVIDFDDQKLRAFRLLQAQPGALAGVRARYDEVIVDEFQDINRLDVELVRLVAEEATLVVTGDDDQAIYEFRWASPDFLIDPVKTLGRAFTSYELGVNYRCPPLILDHAMQLIGHNRHRVAKSPTSGAASAGTIERIEQGDRLAEAKAILGRIQRLQREQPDGAFRDIGILYRRNAQHFAIQVALATTGVPYTVRKEFDLRIIWDQALRLLDLSTVVRRNDPADAPDYQVAVANFSRFRYITDPARAGIHRAAAAAPETHGPLRWDVVVAAVEAAGGHARAVEFQTAMRRLSSAPTIDAELDIIERDFLGIADTREHAEESP
ncbi:MAG: ATP-dependent helicase, partial [Chloroflexia bacterium]|nr:ATP-dependent helicase [Chloroflexia bacterium]